MTGPSSFRFLGIERPLIAAADWNRCDWPKLWLYNLHYFDDLVADDASDRSEWHRVLIGRWIGDNQPGRGDGWEPYPTSLRIVNWVKWALAGNSLDEEARGSLVVQTRWLRRRLEIHLLGNHLWANAKALVFSGAYFEGEEADNWIAKGLTLLRRELAEQILADGGHFERSPMYHAIILEDLLDLIQLGSVFPGLVAERDVGAWRNAAVRMLYWLRVMTHPDGGIAFFNDAALGIAPSYSALADYVQTLGLPVPEQPLQAVEPLAESGYVRLESESTILIADVGEIGPDYLPGHAHADTLSFELSLHGSRVLVNGGTSTYEAGDERLRQRGTAAHNALEVNGEDSSEVWASFRVARRARPRDVSWGEKDNDLWLQAAHDGYKRLRNVGQVHRVWRLSPYRLTIEDRVEGRPRVSVVYFRAHPDMAFQQSGAGGGTLSGRDFALTWKVSGAANIRIADSTWHPRFGESEPCQVLELNLESGRLTTEFSWE